MNKKFVNRLNNLDPKTWIKFQKSWFVHNPPRRGKDVLSHPAKFPETIAQEFIEFFTKHEQNVLDPMVGTGSTLLGALRSGRNSFGVELNKHYSDIAEKVVKQERTRLGLSENDLISKVITGDATKITELISHHDIPTIDYVLTSPPYWNMLREKGSKTQRKRRESPQLDQFYSDDPNDLGNITDYNLFLEKLTQIFIDLKPLIRPRAYLTIIVKNIKKGGVIYPLAWDLARELSQEYTLKDERIWCQDDIRLMPYGIGNAWVSNTFHHYCLQFRNDMNNSM
jgi:DNA modification methylase